MTKIDEQELIKKLAEWAELEMEYALWDGVIFGSISTEEYMMFLPRKVDNCDVWRPFTKSLDTCFKLLVPKLVSGDIHIEWYTTSDDTAVHLKRATSTVAFVCHPNPALALCLAIEKLIDKEGKRFDSLSLCDPDDPRYRNENEETTNDYPRTPR